MIAEYGCAGVDALESYPIGEKERESLRLVLTPIFESIEGTKARYARAVENGRKGGLKGGKLGGRGHKKPSEPRQPDR